MGKEGRKAMINNDQGIIDRKGGAIYNLNKYYR